MENIYVWKTEVYCGGRRQKVGYGFSDPLDFAAMNATVGTLKSKKELVDCLLSFQSSPCEFGKDLLKKGCSNLPTSKIEIKPGPKGGIGEIHLKKPLNDKELSDLAIELTKNLTAVNWKNY